ncbi:MAG: flagellar motor protein MotB [Pseudomonadota bacterium]
MATYSSAHSGRGRSLRRGESRRPGQWKLAYADFLTALMAFFLLMWLSTEQSVENRQGIAAFFNGEEQLNHARSVDASDLSNLLSALETDVSLSQHGHQVIVTETGSGLRVELTDATATPLFASGGTELSGLGIELVSDVAGLLSEQPVLMSIEGHTDAFPASSEGFTNWDLSAARANAARAVLQRSGIPENRIRAVIGLADKHPLLPNQPHAAGNRRISIVLELDG